MFIRLKPRRLKLYDTLRREHLTYREALEFSKMRKHIPPTGGRAKYPPALTAIVRERRGMWKKRVGALYDSLSRIHKGNFFVVRDVHKKPLKTPRLNPWALYDAKYDELPEDQRWDTPRSWRKSLGTDASFRALNRYRVRELKNDAKFFEGGIKR